MADLSRPAGKHLRRADEQVFERVGRGVDFSALARQKRLLYDLLYATRIREPDPNGCTSDPRQELWCLVELCEDLLDAAELEGLWHGDEDNPEAAPVRSAAAGTKP